MIVNRIGDWAGGQLKRAWTRIWQLQCGLAGHDMLYSFEGSKTALRCASCGYTTSGWPAPEEPIKRRFDGDPERHKLR